MKHTIKLFLLPVCLILASCEQKSNTQNPQSLQHHDDSLKNAVVLEVNQNLQHQNDSLKKALTSTTKQVNQDSKQEVFASNAPENTSYKENKTSELIDAKMQLTRLNSLLINAKAKLEYEANELTKAEQFHVGRTKAEREQQIRQQSIKLQSYQNLVQKMENGIIELNNKISSLQNNVAQTN